MQLLLVNAAAQKRGLKFDSSHLVGTTSAAVQHNNGVLERIFQNFLCRCCCVSKRGCSAATTAGMGVAVAATAAGKAQALGSTLQPKTEEQHLEQWQQHEEHQRLPPGQQQREFPQQQPEGEREVYEQQRREGQQQLKQQPHRMNRSRRGCSYLFLREARGRFTTVLRPRQSQRSKQQQQQQEEQLEREEQQRHWPLDEQKSTRVQHQQQQRLEAQTKEQQQLRRVIAREQQEQYRPQQQLPRKKFSHRQQQQQQRGHIRSTDCLTIRGMMKTCTTCSFPSFFSLLRSSCSSPVSSSRSCTLPTSFHLSPSSAFSSSSCSSTSHFPASSSSPPFSSFVFCSPPPPRPSFFLSLSCSFCRVLPFLSSLRARRLSTFCDPSSSGELQRLFQREMREWFVQKKQGTHWHLWYPPGILFSNTRHQKRGVVTPPLPQWYFPSSSSSSTPAHPADDIFSPDNDTSSCFSRFPFSPGSFSSPASLSPAASASSTSPFTAAATVDFGGSECSPPSSEDGRGPTPVAGSSPSSSFPSPFPAPASSSSSPPSSFPSSSSFSPPASSSSLSVPCCALCFLSRSKASVAFLVQQVLLHPRHFYVAVAPDYDVCFLLLRLAARAYGLTPWKLAFLPNLRILCTHPLHVPAFIPSGLLSEVYVHLTDVHAAVRRFCTSRCPLLSPTFLPQLHTKLQAHSNIYIFVETPTFSATAASSPASFSLQVNEKNSKVSEHQQPSLHASASPPPFAVSPSVGNRSPLSRSRSSNSCATGQREEEEEKEGKTREKAALHLLLQLLQQTTAATGLRDFCDTPVRRKRAAAFAAAAATACSSSLPSAAALFATKPALAASAAAASSASAAGARRSPNLLQLLVPSRWGGSCVRVEQTAAAAAAAASSDNELQQHRQQRRRRRADLLFALDTGEDVCFSLYLARLIASRRQAQQQHQRFVGEQREQHAPQQQEEEAQLQQSQQGVGVSPLQQQRPTGEHDEVERPLEEQEYEAEWQAALQRDWQDAAEGWMGMGPLKSFGSILREELQQPLESQQRQLEQQRFELWGRQQQLGLPLQRRRKIERLSLLHDGDSSRQTSTVREVLRTDASKEEDRRWREDSEEDQGGSGKKEEGEVGEAGMYKPVQCTALSGQMQVKYGDGSHETRRGVEDPGRINGFFSPRRRLRRGSTRRSPLAVAAAFSLHHRSNSSSRRRHSRRRRVTCGGAGGEETRHMPAAGESANGKESANRLCRHAKTKTGSSRGRGRRSWWTEARSETRRGSESARLPGEAGPALLGGRGERNASSSSTAGLYEQTSSGARSCLSATDVSSTCHKRKKNGGGGRGEDGGGSSSGTRQTETASHGVMGCLSGRDTQGEATAGRFGGRKKRQLLLSKQTKKIEEEDEGEREKMQAEERKRAAECRREDGVQQRRRRVVFLRTPTHAAEVTQGGDGEGEGNQAGERNGPAEEQWEVEGQKGKGKTEEDDRRRHRGVSQQRNAAGENVGNFAAGVRRNNECNALALPSGGFVVFTENEEEEVSSFSSSSRYSSLSSSSSEQQVPHLQQRDGSLRQHQQQQHNIGIQLPRQKEKQQQLSQQKQLARLERQQEPQQKKQPRQQVQQQQQQERGVFEPQQQHREQQPEEDVRCQQRQEQQMSAWVEDARQKPEEEQLSPHKSSFIREQWNTGVAAAAAAALGQADVPQQRQQPWQQPGREDGVDGHGSRTKCAKKPVPSCAAQCSTTSSSGRKSCREEAEGRNNRRGGGGGGSSRNKTPAAAASSSFAWVKLKKLDPQLPNFRYLLYRL